jgi:3,5-epimerase/4-reductase
MNIYNLSVTQEGNFIRAKNSNNNFFLDKRGSIINITHDIKYEQSFISKNKKNVLRGIHLSPYDKYVTLLSGKIIDYVIYFNNDEITYDKFIMDSSTNNYLFIPKYCGHLFIALEDDTNLLYQLCGSYNENIDININYKDPYINLDIIDNSSYIVSEKDNNSNFSKNIDYILFGSTGFLGSEFEKILKKEKKNYIIINTRLENYNEIKYKLQLYKPKYVICAAGISGRPTIAWCDNNKEETFKTNVIDILNLCEITKNLDIKLVIFGSGSIYRSIINDKKQDLKQYTEYCNIEKNNDNFYLKCRNTLEDYIDLYKNVLYLRIQYPICDSDNEKCFIQKMLKRLDAVHDIYINITYISNLFPLICKILEDNLYSGVLNFVNADCIKIADILKSYFIKNNLNYSFNVEIPDKCCGILNTNKLYNLFPNQVLTTTEIFKL